MSYTLTLDLMNCVSVRSPAHKRLLKATVLGSHGVLIGFERRKMFIDEAVLTSLMAVNLTLTCDLTNCGFTIQF